MTEFYSTAATAHAANISSESLGNWTRRRLLEALSKGMQGKRNEYTLTQVIRAAIIKKCIDNGMQTRTAARLAQFYEVTHEDPPLPKGYAQYLFCQSSSPDHPRGREGIINATGVSQNADDKEDLIFAVNLNRVKEETLRRLEEF